MIDVDGIHCIHPAILLIVLGDGIKILTFRRPGHLLDSFD